MNNITTPALLRLINDRKNYAYSNGTFKIFNVCMWSLPIISLVALQQGLEKNFDKKKVNDLFYLIGQAQSYHATKWMVEKVGISIAGNELRILKETTGHGELGGMGITKILTFEKELKKVTASIKNDLFDLQYKQAYNGTDCADHYQRGLFSGVLQQLFQTNMVVTAERDAKKQIILKAMPLECAREDPTLAKFIPDESLDTSFLSEFTYRRQLF